MKIVGVLMQPGGGGISVMKQKLIRAYTHLQYTRVWQKSRQHHTLKNFISQFTFNQPCDQRSQVDTAIQSGSTGRIYELIRCFN